MQTEGPCVYMVDGTKIRLFEKLPTFFYLQAPKLLQMGEGKNNESWPCYWLQVALVVEGLRSSFFPSVELIRGIHIATALREMTFTPTTCSTFK